MKPCKPQPPSMAPHLRQSKSGPGGSCLPGLKSGTAILNSYWGGACLPRNPGQDGVARVLKGHCGSTFDRSQADPRRLSIIEKKKPLLRFCSRLAASTRALLSPASRMLALNVHCTAPAASNIDSSMPQVAQIQESIISSNSQKASTLIFGYRFLPAPRSTARVTGSMVHL